MLNSSRSQLGMTLERFSHAHVPAIQMIASDEMNTRYTNTPFPYPEEGAIDFLAFCNDEWELNISRTYTVLWNGTVIGNASVVHLQTDEPLLGYMIDKAFWNCGMGTQLVSKLCDICRNVLQIQNVFAPVLPENLSSQRVLIKNGFFESKRFTLPLDYPKFASREMIQFAKDLVV